MVDQDLEYDVNAKHGVTQHWEFILVQYKVDCGHPVR